MGGWAHRVCLGGSNTQAKPPTEAGKASSWFPVQKEKRVGRLVTSAALLPLLVSRWIASAADVDAAAAYALRVVDWTAPWLMQKASKRTSCTMWAIRTTRATNADCCVFRAFWAKRRRPRQGGMLGVTPGGVDALKRKHDAPLRSPSLLLLPTPRPPLTPLPCRRGRAAATGIIAGAAVRPAGLREEAKRREDGWGTLHRLTLLVNERTNPTPANVRAAIEAAEASANWK